MKKKCITGFAILLCVVGFITAGCGSDEQTAPREDAVEVAAPEESVDEIVEEPVVEEYTEDSIAEDGYIETGNVLSFNNGTIIIEDIGIYSQDDWAILYVVLDAENSSDNVITVSQFDASIYVDDYQIPNGFEDFTSITDVKISQAMQEGIKIDGVTLSSGEIDINPGRKAKYIMYNPIVESMEAGEKVEYEIFSGRSVLFKKDGKWNYSSGNGVAEDTEEGEINIGATTDGIGNLIIDANPDRYIPEGISGEIDIIDGTFYSNKPTNGGIIPGEYLIVGGENAVIVIEGNKMSLRFLGSEFDFEDADMEELINCPEVCSYQVYGNGKGYVVSFYEGGLYLYTDEPDTDSDYAEGFYEKL